MKLGIRTLEYIPAANVLSFSHVTPNGFFDITNFISSSFTRLEFTHLSVSLEEEWIDSPSGIYSVAKITGVIRAKKEMMKAVMTEIRTKKTIFRVTTMEGVRLIVGSKEFPCKSLYKLVESVISTSEYQFTIEAKTIQGTLTDTSS